MYLCSVIKTTQYYIANINKVFEMNKENSIKAKSLKDFYNKLPESRVVSPKGDFLRELVNRCNVTYTTARNWIVYGMRPSNKENLKILSELTGIPEDHLFED